MKSNWYCKYKLAHRGLHTDNFPENSLPAFENAIKHGFAIELDVRLTKDGTCVVLHDDNLNRMCGIDIDLKDITYEELSKHKLLNSEYSAPSLKQVLELVNGRTPIMIELKPCSRKYHLEEKVCSLLDNYEGEFAVKSFYPITMWWFRRHRPNYIRGMLSSRFEGEKMPRLYKALLSKLAFYRLIKPDFISYDIDSLPNKAVSNKHIPVLSWTITSKEMEERALQLSETIIFENYIPDSPTNN